ncbi:MAG: helix-turn-helix domain-containing protein [Sphingomonadales bacterium]
MLNAPHAVDVHVGQKIRAKRRQLKMSQSALGKEIGLTFQQVQKYEKGTNRVSASVLYKIAMIFDESFTYFFEGLDAQDDAEMTSANEISLRIKDTKIRKAFLNLAESIEKQNR